MKKTFIPPVKLPGINYKISRKLFVLELMSMFVIGFISGMFAHLIINRGCSDMMIKGSSHKYLIIG